MVPSTGRPGRNLLARRGGGHSLHLEDGQRQRKEAVRGLRAANRNVAGFCSDTVGLTPVVGGVALTGAQGVGKSPDLQALFQWSQRSEVQSARSGSVVGFTANNAMVRPSSLSVALMSTPGSEGSSASMRTFRGREPACVA